MWKWVFKDELSVALWTPVRKQLLILSNLSGLTLSLAKNAKFLMNFFFLSHNSIRDEPKIHRQLEECAKIWNSVHRIWLIHTQLIASDTPDCLPFSSILHLPLFSESKLYSPFKVQSRFYLLHKFCQALSITPWFFSNVNVSNISSDLESDRLLIEHTVKCSCVLPL